MSIPAIAINIKGEGRAGATILAARIHDDFAVFLFAG
jgi:hypothetical protein